MHNQIERRWIGGFHSMPLAVSAVEIIVIVHKSTARIYTTPEMAIILRSTASHPINTVLFLPSSNCWTAQWFSSLALITHCVSLTGPGFNDP